MNDEILDMEEYQTAVDYFNAQNYKEAVLYYDSSIILFQHFIIFSLQLVYCAEHFCFILFLKPLLCLLDAGVCFVQFPHSHIAVSYLAFYPVFHGSPRLHRFFYSI